MFEMKTRIIVDSTTDLTPEVKSRVSLVPQGCRLAVDRHPALLYVDLRPAAGADSRR